MGAYSTVVRSKCLERILQLQFTQINGKDFLLLIRHSNYPRRKSLGNFFIKNTACCRLSHKVRYSDENLERRIRFDRKCEKCRFLGPVYTIPFSFHIGLVSYRFGLLFTRYRFHSISDWPPVYTRTHQSDMLHTVFAFSNENALKVA